MDAKQERRSLFLVGTLPVCATFQVAAMTFQVDPEWQFLLLAFGAIPPACGSILLVAGLLNYWSAKRPPDAP